MIQRRHRVRLTWQQVFFGGSEGGNSETDSLGAIGDEGKGVLDHTVEADLRSRSMT